MTLKTIIIDDAKYIRIELKNLLMKYSYVEIVAEASNGGDAVNLINELKPDLIFLDIHMPNLSGLQVLKSVKIDFDIIFISSYSKYLPEAKNYKPIEFLMKPINIEKLDKAMKKLGNKIQV